MIYNAQWLALCKVYKWCNYNVQYKRQFPVFSTKSSTLALEKLRKHLEKINIFIRSGTCTKESMSGGKWLPISDNFIDWRAKCFWLWQKKLSSNVKCLTVSFGTAFYFAATAKEMKFCLVSVRGKDKSLYQEFLLTLLHFVSEIKWRFAAYWILKPRKWDGRKKKLKKNYIHSLLVILFASRALNSCIIGLTDSFNKQC